MERLTYIMIGIMVLLLLIAVGFTIYVYSTYGNTPITELPAWVLPFLVK